MTDTARVGLVFVSHSRQIAEGLVDLAGQMAPNTVLVPAGGMESGDLGTSFELIVEGIAKAESGAGVVVLCDLGSAILTAETAIDTLADPDQVRLVDAPLVEGGVAAAVAAETGGDLNAVVAAARSAYDHPGSDDTSVSGAVPGGAPAGAHEYSRTAVLKNPSGLHARPAAEFVKLAHTFNSHVTVNGRDAGSLLGIMSLGLGQGDSVTVASSDGQAQAAVDALIDLIESGFGEV